MNKLSVPSDLSNTIPTKVFGKTNTASLDAAWPYVRNFSSQVDPFNRGGDVDEKKFTLQIFQKINSAELLQNLQGSDIFTGVRTDRYDDIFVDFREDVLVSSTEIPGVLANVNLGLSSDTFGSKVSRRVKLKDVWPLARFEMLHPIPIPPEGEGIERRQSVVRKENESRPWPQLAIQRRLPEALQSLAASNRRRPVAFQGGGFLQAQGGHMSSPSKAHGTCQEPSTRKSTFGSVSIEMAYAQHDESGRIDRQERTQRDVRFRLPARPWPVHARAGSGRPHVPRHVSKGRP